MISLIVRTWKPDASEIIVYVTMLFILKRIITAAVAAAIHTVTQRHREDFMSRHMKVQLQSDYSCLHERVSSSGE